MDMQILQQINHWAACARLTSECSSVVHADLLEKAADHITSIESQLETARKRITELENAALVPGVLHCAKCNFQLSKTNLYMKSGTTGPGDNKTEPCPNGCGPLWPVTWRLWAFDASATADKYFDELKAAEARLSAANEKPLALVILEIANERLRQISVEGWTPEHDDQHSSGELAGAAGCYAKHVNARQWCFKNNPDDYQCEPEPSSWPWAAEWWKPKNPRSDLIRAAALIVAELERLDRAAGGKAEGGDNG